MTTPELLRIAESSYDAEPGTPPSDICAMKEALTAAFDAIKEQANG